MNYTRFDEQAMTMKATKEAHGVRTFASLYSSEHVYKVEKFDDFSGQGHTITLYANGVQRASYRLRWPADYPAYTRVCANLKREVDGKL